MTEYFTLNHNRFASFGIVNTLPPEIIDSFWLMIDQNLKGLLPLNSLLHFNLINHNGALTIHYKSSESDIALSMDLPFDYDFGWPTEVYAYDNGQQATIVLPAELRAKTN
jgi:hypothetical protein